jgi:hypothetical protein
MILLLIYIFIFLISLIGAIRKPKNNNQLLLTTFSWAFIGVNFFYIIKYFNEAISVLGLNEKGFLTKTVGFIEYEIFWIFPYNWFKILAASIIIGIILFGALSRRNKKISNRNDVF